MMTDADEKVKILPLFFHVLADTDDGNVFEICYCSQKYTVVLQ
jgi:hypothetical protein